MNNFGRPRFIMPDSNIKALIDEGCLICSGLNFINQAITLTENIDFYVNKLLNNNVMSDKFMIKSWTDFSRVITDNQLIFDTIKEPLLLSNLTEDQSYFVKVRGYHWELGTRFGDIIRLDDPGYSVDAYCDLNGNVWSFKKGRDNTDGYVLKPKNNVTKVVGINVSGC